MKIDPTRCDNFVEMVTDYLEEALSDEMRSKFEDHSGECPGCETYLDQIRTTIRLLAEAVDDHTDRKVKDDLLAKLAAARR